MFAWIRTAWNQFSQIGIRPNLPPEQAMRVRLLNRIWAGTALLILFYLVEDILQADWSGTLLEVVSVIVYIIILWLNGRGSIHSARWTYLIFNLLLVSVAMSLYGAQLGGEISVMSLVLISLVLFVELKPKVVYIGLVFIFFLFVQYWLSQNPPPFEASLSYYSKTYLFTACLIAFLVIGHAFVQENKQIQSKLKQLLHEVNEKNQELEAQQTILDQRNHALGQANMELERFAHIASHDLKTPLRNIITFLELIDKKLDKDDQTLQQYIAIASRSGSQLYSLIQDIGAYARLGHGPEGSATCDLNTVFSKSVQNLTHLLDGQKANVRSAPLPCIRIFQAHAILLFQNLIENGLKYNQSSLPEVDIFTRDLPDAWELCFRDNGIGIDQAYRGDIFEMFKRLHNQDTYAGSGLGLAICKRIVQQYQGSIHVESNAFGGSTFVIRWPNHLLIKEASASSPTALSPLNV